MAEAQGTGKSKQKAGEQQNVPQTGQQPATQVQQPAQPEPAQPEPAKTGEPKSKEQKPKKQTVKKRTQEQINKILDSNKRLFEANELLRREMSNRAASDQQFGPIQQPPVQQPTDQAAQQQINPNDFVEVDPVSGERFINDKKLQDRISEVNSRATRAEESVKKYIQSAEQREIERQNREAFSSYPELNPADPGFDVSFHNQTRALIYDSLINPQDYGGQAMSFKVAAEFVKEGGQATKPEPKENQQDAESQKGEETPPGEQQSAETQTQTEDELKQQASASAAGENPQQRETTGGSEELKRLQLATRLGDREALVKRIAGTDHVVKKDEGESPPSAG